MIWFNGLFLLIWPMIEWKCLGLSIVSSKLIEEPEAEPIHDHKRPLMIIRLTNHDDDDQPQPPSSSLVRAEDDLAEDNVNVGEHWEHPTRNLVQLWRLNARPAMNKRPSGGMIFNRPLPRRPLPASCRGGPAMFQSCCARLNEMAHEYDNIQQFCFYGKCCVNLNLTSTSPAPAATVEPSAGGSSPAPTPLLTVEVTPPAITTTTPSARVTSPTADKRIRPNETKAKASAESNTLLNKTNLKAVSSNEVDTNEKEPKASSDVSHETPIGEPASGGKLLKMRGKGKDFLSREEADEDVKKVEEPLDIEEEVSEEVSSEDLLSDDGAAVLDEAKNSSKPLVTGTPKTATSKVRIDDVEYENAEDSVEERGGNSAPGSSSDEASQIDDKVVNDSGDAEAAPVPKWITNIKPYPRVHLKNRLNSANKFPKKIVATTAISSGVVTPAANSNSTNKSSTAITDDDEDVANVSSTAKNSSSNLTPRTTNRNAANVSPQLTTAPPLVQLRHQVNAGNLAVKQKCPENRGGPNCAIDITGAISGYGYYVVGHSRALSRSESVRECAGRNMTLAFLTNHNEDRLLRRLVNGNATYWIGLTKHLAKGEMKSRYRWEDGSDAGTYIARYMALDTDSQKSKEEGVLTCVVKLHNGKMMVECSTGQSQQTAFPMCMYRPPNIIQPTETTSSDN